VILIAFSIALGALYPAVRHAELASGLLNAFSQN